MKRNSVRPLVRELKVSLEDILDLIENEDLQLAIAYLQQREDEWQDHLSMPSS